LLAGKKFEVGDEVVLKIVGMHEDEVAVEYASEKPDDDKDKGDENEPPPPPPPPSGGDEMESMMG
jgi:hypothetical protein